MSQTAAAFFFQLQGTSKAGLLSKPSPAPGASPISPVFQLVLADSVRSQAGSLVPPQSVRAIPASLEKLQQQSNETIHVYPLPKGSVKIDAEGNILLSPSVWKAIQTGTEIPTTLGTDPTSQTDEAAMIRIPIENKGDIQAFYQFLETGIESDAGEGQSEFLSITQPPLQVAAPQSLQQIASEAPEKPEIPAAANSLPPVQKPQTEENRPVDIKTAGAEKIVPTPQRNPALPPVLTHFLQQAAANQELPALTAAIHQIAQSTHSEDFMDALHEFGKSHGLDISTILNNASRLASSRQDNLAAPSAQTVQPNPSKPSPENSAGEPKPSIQDNRSHTQASPSVPIRVETKQASQPETQAYTAERFAKPGKTSNASTGFQKDHTNFTRTTIQETLTEENTGNNSPVAPTESEHSFNRGENKPSQEQPIPSVVFSAPRSVNPASATATAPAPIRMETKQASQPEILANPATRSVELGKTAVAPARFHEEHTHSAQTAIQEVLIEDNPRHDSPVPPTDAKHPVNRGEKTPSQEQPSPARVPSVSIPVPTPVTAASESIPLVPQPKEAVQERDSVRHPRGPIPAQMKWNANPAAHSGLPEVITPGKSPTFSTAAIQPGENQPVFAEKGESVENISVESMQTPVKSNPAHVQPQGLGEATEEIKTTGVSFPIADRKERTPKDSNPAREPMVSEQVESHRTSGQPVQVEPVRGIETKAPHPVSGVVAGIKVQRPQGPHYPNPIPATTAEPVPRREAPLAPLASASSATGEYSPVRQKQNVDSAVPPLKNDSSPVQSTEPQPKPATLGLPPAVQAVMRHVIVAWVQEQRILAQEGQTTAPSPGAPTANPASDPQTRSLPKSNFFPAQPQGAPAIQKTQINQPHQPAPVLKQEIPAASVAQSAQAVTTTPLASLRQDRVVSPKTDSSKQTGSIKVTVPLPEQTVEKKPVPPQVDSPSRFSKQSKSPSIEKAAPLQELFTLVKAWKTTEDYNKGVRSLEEIGKGTEPSSLPFAKESTPAQGTLESPIQKVSITTQEASTWPIHGNMQPVVASEQPVIAYLLVEETGGEAEMVQPDVQPGLAPRTDSLSLPTNPVVWAETGSRTLPQAPVAAIRFAEPVSLFVQEETGPVSQFISMDSPGEAEPTVISAQIQTQPQAQKHTEPIPKAAWIQARQEIHPPSQEEKTTFPQDTDPKSERAFNHTESVLQQPDKPRTPRPVEWSSSRRDESIPRHAAEPKATHPVKATVGIPEPDHPRETGSVLSVGKSSQTTSAPRSEKTISLNSILTRTDHPAETKPTRQTEKSYSSPIEKINTQPVFDRGQSRSIYTSVSSPQSRMDQQSAKVTSRSSDSQPTPLKAEAFRTLISEEPQAKQSTFEIRAEAKPQPQRNPRNPMAEIRQPVQTAKAEIAALPVSTTPEGPVSNPAGKPLETRSAFSEPRMAASENRMATPARQAEKSSQILESKTPAFSQHRVAPHADMPDPRQGNAHPENQTSTRGMAFPEGTLLNTPTSPLSGAVPQSPASPMEARESSGNEPNNPIPTPERPGEPKIVEEIPREIREIRTRQVEEPEEQREKTPEEPKLAETRSHSAIKKQYAVYTVHQDDLPTTSAARKEQVVMVTPHIHSDLLTRSFEQYSHLQQTRNLEQGLSLFSPQYPQMGNASSQDSKRGGNNPHPGSEPASAKTGGTDSIPASAAAKEQSSGGENPSDRGMANKKEEWPTPNLNQTHSHAAPSEPAGGDAPKPSAPAPTAPGGSGHSSMGSNPTLAQETEGTASTQETIDRILKMQDSVSQQIVHSIQGSLGSSRSFISLRLNPQSLGSLSIHLKMESGKLTASLAAEKETTRALIEKNVSALRSSLDEAGIKVDRIAIVREAQEVKQTDNNKSDSNAHRFGRSKEETAHQFSRDQQQRRRQANGNEWKEQFSAQDYFL